MPAGRPAARRGRRGPRPRPDPRRHPERRGRAGPMSTAGAYEAARPARGAPATTPVRVAERLVAERTGIELGDGLRERLAAYLDEAARARDQTPARFAAGLAGDPGAFQELLDRVTVQETGVLPPSRPVRRPGPRGAARPRRPGGRLERRLRQRPGGLQPGHGAGRAPASPTGRWWPPTSRPPRSPGPAPAATPPPSWTASPRPTATGSARRGNLWEVDPALRHRVTGGAAQPDRPGSRWARAAARSCSAATCSSTCPGTATGSFLDRLADWLAPGGLVFLGYSEVVLAPTPHLRVQRSASPTPSGSFPGRPRVGSWAGSRSAGVLDDRNPRTRRWATLPRRGTRHRVAGVEGAHGTGDSVGGASRPTTAAEMAQAGGARLAWATTPRPSPRSARRCSSTPTTLWPASSWASRSGRTGTGAVPGGPTRPPGPRSNGATRRRSGPGSTGCGGDELGRRAPSQAGAAVTTVVSFRSGGQDWGVALERVSGSARQGACCPSPTPRPGVAGLLHRDGDDRHRGVAPRWRPAGPVVVLDDGATSIGLLVDEVVGIERVQEEAGAPPAGQRSPLVAGVLPGARLAAAARRRGARATQARGPDVSATRPWSWSPRTRWSSGPCWSSSSSRAATG